jgi:hypothetical protein
MRSKIRRLEKRAQGHPITIPQPDGTTVRLPQSTMKAAFMTNVRRIQGENVKEHPLLWRPRARPKVPRENRSLPAASSSVTR